MLDKKHFAAIEESVSEQAEEYRSRWLSTKLSLYGSFLTFSGLALAAATLFAQTPASRTIATIVIFMSVVSALFVFVQYHWLVRLYDSLGFSEVHFESQRDIDEYEKRQAEHYREFLRRKRLRRFMDTTLYVVAITQVALLGLASCLL